MLDMTPETIQIIIQGGAVGILLAFGVMFFGVLRLAINKGSEFVNNHLAHNTAAVEEGTDVMREVALEVRRMADKLDK